MLEGCLLYDPLERVAVEAHYQRLPASIERRLLILLSDLRDGQRDPVGELLHVCARQRDLYPSQSPQDREDTPEPLQVDVEEVPLQVEGHLAVVSHEVGRARPVEVLDYAVELGLPSHDLDQAGRLERLEVVADRRVRDLEQVREHLLGQLALGEVPKDLPLYRDDQ